MMLIFTSQQPLYCNLHLSCAHVAQAHTLCLQSMQRNSRSALKIPNALFHVRRIMTAHQTQITAFSVKRHNAEYRLGKFISRTKRGYHRLNCIAVGQRLG